MRPSLLSAIVLSVLVAGCAEEAVPMNVAAPVSRQNVEVLPAERPLAAAVTWHEDRQATQRVVSSDTFVITNSWEPRDADLTYHGVQPVLDEWGRAVDAHVFRYPAMRLQVTDVDLVGDFPGVKVTARWEESTTEYAFDATDGRLMGYADLKHQLRSFADPRWREPLVGGYEGSMLVGMAYQALGGDLSRGIETWTGNITFDESEFRPLEGDCQPYEFGFEPAAWYREWMEREGYEPQAVPEAEEWRDAVCIEEDGNPLWSYAGNETDHLSLTRVSPAFPLPALTGTPLPPAEFERRPMEPLDLLLGLSGPVDVPPSQYPGDWADIVRPVVAGLGTNLDYVQYSRQAEQEYINYLVKGWPAFAPFLEVPVLGEGPLAWEEHSWVWSADGARAFWGMVDSRYGTPEEPDVHLSRNGNVIDDYPTHRAEQVAAGAVQQAWGPLIPEENRMLHYYSFPDLFDDLPHQAKDYLAPFLNTWYSFEHCFENVEGGKFVDFSFLTGQMLAMGGQDSYWTGTGGGCSAGVQSDASTGSDAPLLRIPSAAGDLLMRPAQDGQPGFLLVGHGLAFDGLVRGHDVILLPSAVPPGASLHH